MKFITWAADKSKICMGSGQPVLDSEPGNAAVVADVAGDQGQVVGDGYGGDLEVRLEAGQPSLFDLRFNPSKHSGAVPVEDHNGPRGKTKLFEDIHLVNLPLRDMHILRKIPFVLY